MASPLTKFALKIVKIPRNPNGLRGFFLYCRQFIDFYTTSNKINNLASILEKTLENGCAFGRVIEFTENKDVSCH